MELLAVFLEVKVAANNGKTSSTAAQELFRQKKPPK